MRAPLTLQTLKDNKTYSAAAAAAITTTTTNTTIKNTTNGATNPTTVNHHQNQNPPLPSYGGHGEDGRHYGQVGQEIGGSAELLAEHPVPGKIKFSLESFFILFTEAAY